MSAIMARQGGRVQLEQSDMRLAFNMAKMANCGFSLAAILVRQQLIKKPRAEVQEEKKRRVEFPVHQNMRAPKDRLRAIVYKHHTAGCLPCNNGTARNPQTCLRGKETASPPPEPAAPPPRMPPAPPGDADANESYEIEGMPSRCVYMHSPLPNTQIFNHNAYAKESKHDKDLIPDLLSTLSAS
jgi:hypothetical protein